MAVEPDTEYDGKDYTYLVNTQEITEGVWEVRLRVDPNSNRILYSDKHSALNEGKAIDQVVENF